MKHRVLDLSLNTSERASERVERAVVSICGMLTLRRITRIGEFDRRLKNEFREKYDAFSIIDEEDKEIPGIENNYLFIYANISHTVDQYDSIRAICID